MHLRAEIDLVSEKLWNAINLVLLNSVEVVNPIVWNVFCLMNYLNLVCFINRRGHAVA